jgi:hypothetical protein
VSTPSALAALEYAPESAFAEDSSTFATHRIPVRDAIDPSGLIHAKEPTGHVTQYLTPGQGYVLMGQAGSFVTKLDLTGHGSSTAGSPSLSAMETLLGYVFGNVALSAPASTTLTGGTAAVPTTTASGTFTAGSLAFVGALGDGDGDGQAYAIGTHSGTNLNLLTALNGAPVNGAVLYPAANFYVHETPYGAGLNASTPGLRFRFISNNIQYACHGCYPTAIALSGLSPGERPTIDVTWAVSRWAHVSATVPSAVSTTTNVPAPVAAGSLWVNDVGTTTSSKRVHRSMSIEMTLNMAGLPGPAGVGAYQSIVGCSRLGSTTKITWVEDADTTTTTPVLPGWGTGTTNKHILLTLSSTAGSRVAFYLPNVCPATVPVQFNDGGFNRLRFEGMAHTGTTTTTNLTTSSLRMAWG